jgi:hypothetical protein
MKISRIVVAIFFLLFLLLWILPQGMGAQDVNRAALVIRTSDQDVQTACVEFSEPEISGLDVLQQSEIAFEIDVQSMGAKVCSIEQTGCPVDDCWCQCKGGGDCIYWSYWHQQNDQWTYSQGGASMYSVSDGDVEGWSWGPGSVTEAFAPPDLSFTDVCTAEQAEEPTSTPSPTATEEPVLFVPADTPTSGPTQNQAAGAATVTPLPTATFVQTSTAVPTATPLPTNPASAVSRVTRQPDVEAVDSEPAAVSESSIESPEVVADQPPDPPATSEPLPTPSPLPPSPSPEASQAAPQAVAAAAETVDSGLPTRPPQRDIKNPVVGEAGPDQDLTVIGAALQLEDMGPAQIDAETYQAEIGDQNSSTSIFSYAIFCLIVAALTGLLLWSTIRRRALRD